MSHHPGPPRGHGVCGDPPALSISWGGEQAMGGLRSIPSLCQPLSWVGGQAQSPPRGSSRGAGPRPFSWSGLGPEVGDAASSCSALQPPSGGGEDINDSFKVWARLGEGHVL